jgi:hypothetical protein
MGLLGIHMSHDEHITKRIASLEARIMELTVQLVALSDQQALDHQRLLRLEQTRATVKPPITLSERFSRIWGSRVP